MDHRRQAGYVRRGRAWARRFELLALLDTLCALLGAWAPALTRQAVPVVIHRRRTNLPEVVAEMH
jgi:hypothetical protein